MAQLHFRHQWSLTRRALELAELPFQTVQLSEADRARVEDGIRRCYEAAAVRFPPRVLWVASPLQGALAASAIASTLAKNRAPRGAEEPLRNGLVRMYRTVLLASAAWLGGLIDRLFGHRVLRRGGFGHVAVRIWQAVHRPIARATERAGVSLWIYRSLSGNVLPLMATESVRTQLERALAAQLDAAGYASLTQDTALALQALLPHAALALDTPRAVLRERMPHLWGRHSLFHERAWVLEQLAPELPACSDPMLRARAAALLDANLAGPIWMHRDFVVISELPAELRFEEHGGEKRLHCHDAAAIHYRDGFGVYASHGFPIDPDIVLRERSLEEIFSISSDVVRFAALERLGWLKFIERSGALPRAEVPDPGNPARCLALYDPPDDLAGEFQLLRMHNGSPEPDGTFRTFVELVPSHFQDPIEAVASQYGCSAEAYRALHRRT